MYLEPFYALLHSSLKHSFKCDFCPPTHHFTSCVIKIQVHPMQMSYSFRHVYEGCKIRLAKYQSLFVFFLHNNVYWQWLSIRVHSMKYSIDCGFFSKTNKRVYFGVVFRYLSHVTFFILVNSSGTLLGEKLQLWLSNEYLVVLMFKLWYLHSLASTVLC